MSIKLLPNINKINPIQIHKIHKINKINKAYDGLKNPHSVQQGFTLFEILIVLTIIGITFTFAVLAIGDFGAKRQALVAAEQLKNYMDLLQEQAVLEGNSLALEFAPNYYDTYRLEQGKTWHLYQPKTFFKRHYLPAGITLTVSHQQPANAPQVMFSPSGGASNFKATFISQHTNIATVSSHNAQSIVLIRNTK